MTGMTALISSGEVSDDCVSKFTSLVFTITFFIITAPGEEMSFWHSCVDPEIFSGGWGPASGQGGSDFKTHNLDNRGGPDLR